MEVYLANKSDSELIAKIFKFQAPRFTYRADTTDLFIHSVIVCYCIFIIILNNFPSVGLTPAKPILFVVVVSYS